MIRPKTPPPQREVAGCEAREESPTRIPINPEKEQ